jgi:hypothetical protein
MPVEIADITYGGYQISAGAAFVYQESLKLKEAGLDGGSFFCPVNPIDI